MATSNSSKTNVTKQSKNDKKNKQKAASPPKPYTKYTIFFRLERMRLLIESGLVDDEIRATLQPNHFDYIEHPRPSKYRDVQMPPFWYSSFVKPEYIENRKHRKIDGRISFKELSQKISATWKEIDEETAAYIEKLADFEQAKYDKMVAVFKKRQWAVKVEDHGTSGPAEDEDLNACSHVKVNTSELAIIRRSSLPAFFSPGEQIGINCNSSNIQEWMQENIVERGYHARLMMHQTMQSQMMQKVMKKNDLEPIHSFSNPKTEDTTSFINPRNKRSFFDLSTEMLESSHRKKRRSIDCASDPTRWNRVEGGTFVGRDGYVRDLRVRRRASFTCVPDWHADDAIRLLEILLPEPDAAGDEHGEKAQNKFICRDCTV